MISGESSNLEKDTSGIARQLSFLEVHPRSLTACPKESHGGTGRRRRLPASFWVSLNVQGRTVRFGEGICVCIVSMHPPSLDFAEDARDRDALEKAKIRCRGGSIGHGWGMLHHPLKVTFIPWYHGMNLCRKFSFKLEFSMGQARFFGGGLSWALLSGGFYHITYNIS